MVTTTAVNKPVKFIRGILKTKVRPGEHAVVLLENGEILQTSPVVCAWTRAGGFIETRNTIYRFR